MFAKDVFHIIFVFFPNILKTKLSACFLNKYLHERYYYLTMGSMMKHLNQMHMISLKLIEQFLVLYHRMMAMSK